MVVVLSGSAGVDLHAMARALARSLDATVLDADRPRGRERGPDDDRWLDELDARLREPGPRPHVVITRTGLTPRARAMLLLRRPRLVLALVRDSARAPAPDASEDEAVVAVDADGPVEVVAARLFGRLVLRLEGPDADPRPEGISPPAGDDVCSDRRG